MSAVKTLILEVITSQDGDIGKVNFKAFATIINSREIFMADNERVSYATRVTR